MFHEIDQILDSFLTMEIPGYDFRVLHHGKEVYRRINGFSDIENRIPMNGSERYNIYSCSKVFTVCAALQLWEKGLYQLDDFLADYMPEFAEMTVNTPDGIRPAQNRITIRHLFTMTAGFTYDLYSENLKQAWADTDGRCPTRETMKYLAKDPLAFEPGTAWNYSLCHDVLAALVEVLSGMKFEEYVRQNIFDPLGMTQSTFLLPVEEYNTVCAQYTDAGQPTGRKRLELTAFSPTDRYCPYRLGTEYASGGAGCVSTVEDYLRFLEALRKKEGVIKPETIAVMTTPQLPSGMETWLPPNYAYGLGVRCAMDPVQNGVTDYGWGGAAGAFLAVDPVHDFTFYYAQHVRNSTVQTQRIQLAQLVRKALSGLNR